MQELNCAGIYKITCSGNNKFYIGSTKCFKKRFKEHRRDLRANRHCSKYLQNCYNKYGSEYIVFEIVEVIEDLTTLLKQEYSYIDSLKPEFNTKLFECKDFKPPDLELNERISIECRKRAKAQISTSITKTTGVTFSPTKNKFAAYITLKDVKIALGSYITLEEATNARKEGERVYWSDKYKELSDEDKKILNIHNKLLRERTTNKTTGHKYISYAKHHNVFIVEVELSKKHRCKTLQEALELRDSYFPKLPEHLTDLLLNV
jgi:group I intron endonuclease